MATTGKPAGKLDCYRPIKDHLWNEASTSLGLKEETSGNSRKFVEAFLGRYDNQENIRYQSVLLEPPSKAAKCSRKSVPRRPRGLSKRQRRKFDLLKFFKKEQKYTLYLPLHELWKGYMEELLKGGGSRNPQMLAQKVLKADLHGCLIKVAESKSVSTVGLEGIILQETQNTFRIICPDDRVKTVPKRQTVFTFTASGHLFTLYGQNLLFRAGDRSSRKFKEKLFVDLQ